jgi:hypothetical protein
VTVTTDSMRHFAADCFKWARDFDDASQRQTIIDAARMWSQTADVIDRRLAEGFACVDDMRRKLT